MSGFPLRFRCSTPDEARYIVSLLLSRNLTRERIEVYSAEPLHDVGEAISGKSRLSAYVMTGAVSGAVGGAALAVVTARLYPIETGGMPLVAPLPVGIVTYEAMMLLAILFALAGLLIEARLIRRRAADSLEHAAPIADGEVHVVARVESTDEAEELRIAVEGSRYASET